MTRRCSRAICLATSPSPRQALPNSRSSQLFINYVNNANLDSMGFAPFGEVEGDGMQVVKTIHNCGEKPNHGSIQSGGNAYLDKEFPKLSKIIKARIIGGDEL